MKTRVCSKCGEEKVLEDFSSNKKCKDGREGVCKACRRKHRAENGKYLAERLRKYQQRAVSSGVVKITVEELKELLRQDDCTYCGESVSGYDKTVDHVYPISEAYGGTNIIQNIVVSCRTCNMSKGGKHVFDFYSNSSRFTDENWTAFVRYYMERLLNRKLTDLEVEQAKRNFADEAADLARNKRKQLVANE